MMPRSSIFIYIIRSIAYSLLLLALPTGSYAQKSKKDLQEIARQKHIDDSIPFFRGIQIKADMVGPVQKTVSDYGQYEGGVRVNFKDKYFPVVEVGIGKADHTNVITQVTYRSSAPYGKIGADFNIMKNKHDIYRIYVGFRYAYTSFKFDVEHADITDPIFGGTTPFSGHDIKADCHWAELVGSIDAKIFGPLHLGWSARYKRRLKHNDGYMGKVWYVPGFGKQGDARLMGTFDIIFEF